MEERKAKDANQVEELSHYEIRRNSDGIGLCIWEVHINSELCAMVKNGNIISCK